MFQIVNIIHGSHLFGDKLVATLILAIYSGGFLVRLEFEPDLVPINKTDLSLD